MAKKEAPKMKNVDDLIARDEAAKLGKPLPEAPKAEAKAEPEPTPETKAESSEVPVPEEKSEGQVEGKKAEPEVPGKEEASKEGTESQKSEKETSVSPKNDKDDDVDEYGTKVAKKKMYSEDEVQRMIRERLARGRQAAETPQQQQEVAKAAKDFTPDPESETPWEVQLEAFVENTIEKVAKKASEKEWKVREQESQAEFEVKFSEGMTKYGDFNDVVSNKPITNAMMLATRSMNDPAAFLYAACKSQSKELARIAAIPDAVTQAAEIGRLEERMKKARTISASPKPAKQISGDASSEMPRLDIDARIAAHAKSKIMR